MVFEARTPATMQAPPRDDSEILEHCQKTLAYRFREPALLREALTHASSANHRLASNERLEFLGDSILGAIVCELLYVTFPDFLEGDLTRIKSAVVSRRTCAQFSEILGFHEFLTLGKGMGGQDHAPSSVFADVFESILGAVYLDGGMEAAKAFVLPLLEPEIQRTVEGQGQANYKSTLQMLAQKRFGETPTYLLLDAQGPDHSKCFEVAAQIGPRQFPSAWGRNKKDAEQAAAMNALSQIEAEPGMES
jgi:ribonuclease III